MERPPAKFLLKLALMALPVFAGYEMLYRLSIYPVLTASQFFDYKVLEAGRHPPGKLSLMAVGSSVTLYDLDSRVIADSLQVPYYNFGSWGMQMTDIRAVLGGLVAAYHPCAVLICASPREFMLPRTPSYADYAGTAAFIRERFPEYFYVRNFNPVHTLWLRRFRSRRPTMDAWGGASVEEMWKGVVRHDKGEQLAFPTADTEAQYAALDSVCRYLREQHIRLVFAQAPMEARYTDSERGRRELAAFQARCGSIVGAAGGNYFNYYDTTVFPDSLFADLTHLTRAGGSILTRKIVADVKATNELAAIIQSGKDRGQHGGTAVKGGQR
ncbi:MAG TPA: hypothetical protein VN616_06970 [Puia sp.]|nr:hypothetical protein [Puia sp.]